MPTSQARVYTVLQCVYCWYLSLKRDLLEGTLEHQTLHAGLAQSNILFWEIWKTLTFPQNWQNKPSQGCWESAFQLPEMLQ